MEQLDGEHTVAMDEVLHMKEVLQRKCTALEAEVAAAQQQQQCTEAQNAVLADSELRLELARSTELNAVLAERESEATRNLDENTRLLTELTAAWTERKAQATAQQHEFDAEKTHLLARVAELQTAVDRLAADKLLVDGELQQAQLNERRASRDEEQLVALQVRVREVEAELELVRSSGGETPVDTVPSIALEQLAGIIEPYAPRVETPSGSDDAVAVDVVRRLRDTLATIDQFKFDLESLAERHHQLGETNARVQHEKDTAQADLHHYELELAEVMKHNETLLAELEAAKAGGKLETISEQNEDNIIHLEQQLEDCSNLNQSLEDEYQQMRDRLATAEQRVHGLVSALREQHERGEELTLLVDGAERRVAELDVALLAEREQRRVDIAADDQRRHELAAELQTLQTRLEEASFELAELKAAERAVTASAVDVAQLDDLRAQVLCLSDAKAQLERQLATAHLQWTDSLEQATATIDEQNARTAADRQLIDKKSADVQELLDQLQATKAEHAAAMAERPDAADDARSKQQTELQLALATAVQEKADLVALVTAKHSESVQYHDEIQRLGRLLHDEQQRRSADAAAAQQLHDQTVALAAALQAEKATNERIAGQLEQQRAERTERLADVQRLRSHLLEVEEAHTSEQMEMQQQVEQLQLKLAGLEQESRKSSTAYTSAR